MSGGHYDYAYYNLDRYEGNMKDDELEVLLNDFKILLHDLEWCDSGDTNEEDYKESVKKFKEKWLKEKR